MPTDPPADQAPTLPAAVDNIALALVTPNETDSNGEAANVVDGLFAIARALNNIAAAIRPPSPARTHYP